MEDTPLSTVGSWEPACERTLTFRGSRGPEVPASRHRTGRTERSDAFRPGDNPTAGADTASRDGTRVAPRRISP